MRQSPEIVPNEADPGAEGALELEDEMHGQTNRSQPPGMGTTDGRSKSKGARGKDPSQLLNIDDHAFAAMPKPEPLSLTGFDSLQTGVPARVAASENRQKRDLRPPFRNHMPDYTAPA